MYRNASRYATAHSQSIRSIGHPVFARWPFLLLAYDDLRRPTLVTTTANGKEYKNNYTYQPATGYLAAVSHNTSDNPADDVHYYFSYDALGRPHQVYVGSAHLSTNTYNSTGTLAQTNFGNGGIVANEYDDWNRLTGVKYEGDLAPRYTYAYNANGQVAHVADAALNRVTQTEYDLANRPCRKKTHENGVHAYTGEVAYDPMTGNLSKFTERVGAGHVPYHTAFGYDEENRPVHLAYSNGAQVTYTYDKLGRVTHRTVNLNGTPLTTAYTYAAGGHGENSTTPLVESISQLDKTTVYGYDDCGNICYESTAGVAVAYAYDPLGQLVRVNDPHDPTAGNGTTWEYEYDQGGNITAKKAYAYTDGLVSTPVQTVPYTYGDSNWKDKLTAYNNSFIAYDAIGNPLGDGTWTYTWAKGRQLQSMSKAGETVSFTYNADGLRVRKVATSTGTTDYTLHGKNVVHMTNGSNSLHFYYDAQNRPAVVEYNWVPYAYVHNLQGDIIAIVDANGNKVVEYKYDAWGKPIAKTGSLANSLGTLNPFRYRGYVYDEETACYYLKTRYYNSAICRFVNADSIIFPDASHNMNNLYSYCKDSPVNYVDENGLMGIAAAGYPIMEMLKAAGMYLLKGLGLFGAAVAITEIDNATSSYNSVDYDTSMAVPMPAPGLAPSISISQVTVTGATTVAQLDQTEVGEKNKKTKPQYWSAHVDKNSGYVIAGCSLSYSAAQARVMAGGDVLAINQSAAYALVKFSGNYVGPEIHHGSKGYYLPHYHVRHGGSHVFFLGGITY